MTEADPRSTADGMASARPDWLEHALDWRHGVTGRVCPTVGSPDPLLAQPGTDVDPASEDVRALAADLIATMGAAPGCVGLAAHQIGVPVRMFALDVRGHPKTRTTHGLLVLCNAEIVAGSQWQKGREGCLSIPDLTGDVKRAGKVTATGSMPGSPAAVTLATDAFEARAIQHEVDHCAGLLFLDKVAGPHAVFARKVYR